MAGRDRALGATNQIFGWMGTILLLGILPVKIARFGHQGATGFAIGVAPSFLGPAGLLFLLLSSTGRISRLSLRRVTLLVAAISLGLELVQLLPRPGALARARYTFDFSDLAATAIRVLLAYAVSVWILGRPTRGQNRHGGEIMSSDMVGGSSMGPWPKSLDAMTAAPDHHTVLLENDEVRVLDTRIGPDEQTPVHTHAWPGVLYVLTWSDIVRVDAEGNVLLDTRNLAATPTEGTTLWAAPLGPHSARNVGSRELRVIAVELKPRSRS